MRIKSKKRDYPCEAIPGVLVSQFPRDPDVSLATTSAAVAGDMARVARPRRGAPERGEVGEQRRNLHACWKGPRQGAAVEVRPELREGDAGPAVGAARPRDGDTGPGGRQALPLPSP